MTLRRVLISRGDRIGASGGGFVVPIEAAGGAIRAETPRVLFDASHYEYRFDVSPDGTRFLMMPQPSVASAATQVQLVTNFLSELKQRVR